MFPLLETLVAVYEVGQFTLAADELKVSQSTVSSRIAQLEQMVGAPLFVRNAKSDVTPTQAGRMLYQTAIGIDGLWRDTREQIARVQEDREPLAVSFSHTTAAILLPKALPVMARNMDGFDFAVQMMNSDAILDQASMKAVHLGVVEKPIVNDSVDRVTLVRGPAGLGGRTRRRMDGARARFRCAVLHGFVFQDYAGFAASHHGGVQQCRDCGGVVFRLWAVADFGSRSAFWSAGAKARRRIRAPFLCLGAEIRPDARSARAGGSDYRCVARIVSALSPVRGEPECGIGKIDDMYW